MNTKLTLSIDKGVIEKAKKYASNKETSVSFLVERFLYNLTKNELEKNKLSIIDLDGILGSKSKNYDWREDRYEYLKKKHGF